ncbi:8718_t:CDS:2, partial [Racocetra persica]
TIQQTNVTPLAIPQQTNVTSPTSSAQISPFTNFTNIHMLLQQQYSQLFAPLALNKTNVENNEEELFVTNNEQENSLTLGTSESTSSSKVGKQQYALQR